MQNTNGFAGMFVGTIDAFCLRILQDYKSEYAQFSVLSRNSEQKAFVERYSDDAGFNDLSEINTIDDFLSLMGLDARKKGELGNA